MNRKGEGEGMVFVGVAVFIIIAIAILMAVIPVYNVWSKELGGKANLKEAEWDRQIQIKEAEANLEAEKLNAKSEVERAIGVAESNKIISTSITENYLKYLYIKGLQTNTMQTIYIPTDGLLPVFDMRKTEK